MTEKRKLAEKEYEIWVEAPRVAEKAKPGQFVILRTTAFGERIPLTIVKTDPLSGRVCLIFQVIGKSTAELAALNPNDRLQDFVGPLGMPSEIKNYGTVLLVGGGVGIAALFPIVKGLKEAGNRVITVLGAKTRELVILKEECRAFSDQLIVMTDDGSDGNQGLVTAAMEDVFLRETVDVAWAIGPSVMMKFAAKMAQNYDVPIYVSLNPIMIDGTGMCGGCRVTVADSVKFACVDGPEFLGTEVNWEEFIQRMKQYSREETDSYEAYIRQVNPFGEKKLQQNTDAGTGAGNPVE
ncbi:sulfide/dihydroorotate dehydrogenase-like FAD/NAD-binding protein [Paenibacillus azoreducens]|nr:sulfide/dihydroorotate dehydrogenase-like FAD/NAD-binding protein [Paenibacillus azoreducens]